MCNREGCSSAYKSILAPDRRLCLRVLQIGCLAIASESHTLWLKKWLVTVRVQDTLRAIIRVAQQVICLKLVQVAIKCETGVLRVLGPRSFFA
jgi:hypothetical protein